MAKFTLWPNVTQATVMKSGCRRPLFCRLFSRLIILSLNVKTVLETLITVSRRLNSRLQRLFVYRHKWQRKAANPCIEEAGTRKCLSFLLEKQYKIKKKELISKTSSIKKIWTNRWSSSEHVCICVTCVCNTLFLCSRRCMSRTHSSLVQQQR